jgi:hypothetical protein
MTPQEKAAMGRKLIKEAVVDYLAIHRDGVTRSDISNALGLLGEPNIFTRTLVKEVLETLEREQRLRCEARAKGRTRYIYYPIANP